MRGLNFSALRSPQFAPNCTKFSLQPFPRLLANAIPLFSSHHLKMNPELRQMNRPPRIQHPWLAVLGSALFLTICPPASAENLKAESRMPFLHHIPLRDVDGQIISLPTAFDEQG